jgi:hypothetical protein
VRQFVDDINHLPSRAAQLGQLNKVSEAGDLSELLDLIDNEKMREADSRGFDAAREAYVNAEAEIFEIRNGRAARAEAARRDGKEAAAIVAACLSGIVGVCALVLKLL